MTDDGALRVTASRIVYENRWMRVREDETLLPDGTPGLYAVIEKASAAVVVPVDEGRIWLVSQHRHTVGARYWELPQGAWDGQERADPEALARGELAEETGLRAARMECLGRLFFAYGMSSQPFTVWRATGLTQGEQALEHTEQGLRVGHFHVEDLSEMIANDHIADAATVAALGLAGLL